ncbi:hypothetical protein [Streptomyces subrutilus]|nr:hypothetical protein [Streptomyces subrutilus]
MAMPSVEEVIALPPRNGNVLTGWITTATPLASRVDNACGW